MIISCVHLMSELTFSASASRPRSFLLTGFSQPSRVSGGDSWVLTTTGPLRSRRVSILREDWLCRFPCFSMTRLAVYNQAFVHRERKLFAYIHCNRRFSTFPYTSAPPKEHFASPLGAQKRMASSPSFILLVGNRRLRDSTPNTWGYLLEATY